MLRGRKRSSDDATLLKLNILLNTSLNGLPIDEINLAMIAELKEQAGIHSRLVSECAAMRLPRPFSWMRILKIYTSGATNILKYPELTDHREKTSESDQCI